MAHSAKPARPSYGQGRDALLDAAIRIVSARGLRGLTLRGVAAEAGVSHGLVRHHFGSRAALLEATLLRSVDLAIDTSSLEPQTGAIDDMSTDLADFIESEPHVTAFQYETLLQARRQPELMPHVRRMYDDYIEATRRELRRAGLGNDPALARAVFAALDGLALQQVVFGHPERTRAGVALLHRLIGAARNGSGARADEDAEAS